MLGFVALLFEYFDYWRSQRERKGRERCMPRLYDGLQITLNGDFFVSTLKEQVWGRWVFGRF